MVSSYSAHTGGSIMKRSLSGITTRVLFALALPAALFAILSNASTEQANRLSERPWTPKQCIALLKDADPLMRSYAIDDLLLSPQASVEYVVAEAKAGDEQTAEICVDMLMEFVFVDDTAVQAAAIDALLELQHNGENSTSMKARQCLLANQDRIGRCCSEALEAVGALVHRFPVTSGFAEAYVPGAVVLGPGWRGKEADLKWICRMPRSPRVYLIDGNEISQDERDSVHSSRPDIVVRRRGRACLGMTFREDDLRVHSITPDSPADVAGIPPSSRLEQFDGVFVSNFDDLLDAMVDRQPGEIVQLTVYNQGETKVIPLRLGSDVGTGVCECDNDPVASADTAAASEAE
jgi:hypothetical protein